MQKAKISFPNQSEFTIYGKSDDEAFWDSVGLRSQSKEELQSDQILLESDDGRIGRGLLASCYDRRYFSLTVRAGLKPGGSTEPGWSGGSETASGYRPSSRVPRGFMSGVSDVTELVWQQLCKTSQISPVSMAGLIVVSGATGSGKSAVATALVDRYLHDKENLSAAYKRKTKLHLVTVEDPIERYMFRSPDEFKSSPIDYTPRQLGRDVSNLRSAFSDALRQGPSIMFVGELRTAKDWADVLEYCRTGHLLVTTCHAASVAETTALAFRSAGARTPPERYSIVDCLLSVVNCRVFDLPGLETRALVPSMWVRNDASRSSLSSEGVASLVPGRSVDFAIRLSGSLGRSWFAGALANAAGPEINSLVASKLERMALEADLDGI
jgi:Type II/IV secretion system protein